MKSSRTRQCIEDAENACRLLGTSLDDARRVVRKSPILLRVLVRLLHEVGWAQSDIGATIGRSQNIVGRQLLQTSPAVDPKDGRMQWGSVASELLRGVVAIRFGIPFDRRRRFDVEAVYDAMYGRET